MVSCTSGVYKITNLINNKIYVGSAVNLSNRKSKHFSNLSKNNHHNDHLQNAYNKYGSANFKFSVIMYVSNIKNSLIETEQYWINTLDACNEKKGYNICPTAGNSLGRSTSEETKNKLRVKMKGRVNSKEQREEIKQRMIGNKYGTGGKGKTVSEETKTKISNVQKKKIINLDTGQLYNSIKDASIACNINEASLSQTVRKYRNRKTAGGYRWEYVNKR
jgi:group I intron endonuclease